MFFKKKLLTMILSLFGFISMENNADALIYYAKIVFLGTYGAGKTTLMRVLTEDNISGSDVIDNIHTRQISDNLIGEFFENEKDQVVAYYYDTSGENDHKIFMQEFSKNAHVALVVADATLMVDKNGNFKEPTEFNKVFQILHNKYAPGCRVIVVLTKLNKVESDTADTTKYKIQRYVEKLATKNPFTKEYVDDCYILTIDKWDSQYTIENHKKDILRLIEKSLAKYGITNLPRKPNNFKGRVGTVVDYKTETYTDYVNETEEVPGECYGTNTRTVQRPVERLRTVSYNKPALLKKW